MASAQNPAPSADLFDSYFRGADLDRDGRISGAEAVSFFQGTGLAKPVLAKIWDFADQNRTGFLGRPEFYNALKLVTVAQSRRELTPDIVKAALYGPAADKIPAPRINLAALPAQQLNTAVPASTTRPGAVPPMPSQTVGYRGPPVPTSSTLSQQHFSPQGSQLMGPPQAVSASSPQPIHNIPTQGLPGGAGAARPNSSSVPGHWSTGTLPGPSGGSVAQVLVRGVGPSATQSGFEFALAVPKASLPPRPQASSGMIPPKPPVKDAKPLDVSSNGFASDAIFGGDIFSANQSQPRQGSSTGNVPLSTAASAPSSAMQPPAPANALDSLQSKHAIQPGGGQLQPAQASVKQGPQGPSSTPFSIMSSGNSKTSQNHSSSQSQMPWPKMTQTDVQKYMKVFVEVDTDKDGKITGEQARNLFLSWRLPREVLKQVWDLSDQDNDSMLSLREFCIALYLMERYREGRPLPSVLPSNIIFDFPTGNQPAMGYMNAGWGPTSGLQQRQVMHGQHAPSAPRGKPPLPPSGPSSDADTPVNQKKSRVPVLEKHLVDQLSKEEQNSLNTRFQEAMDADKKVQELEKEILESKEKIEFYRAKMQELVLYKSRCDNRLNEIMERISGDKREVEVLAKKYEEKYKQTGDVASKLTIEEATFRDIQEKKMDLYRAIVGMDKNGNADGAVQEKANRIQSDLDDLVKGLNERCKSYGLRAKPISLVELPFGWQPGIQATAADWDEDWDKFEDEGFTFVKELTLDVQNVVAPPKEKSKPTPQVETASKVEESPDSPTASPHTEDAKSEKPSTVDGHVVVENGVHHDKSDIGESPRSAPGTPRVRSSIGSPPPKEEFPGVGFGKTSTAETSVSFDKEKTSDHEIAESVFSGDKSFDEPAWGTFDNDDVDSVWGFNAVNSSKETDGDKFKDDYFLGSGDFGLNPIRTSAEPSFPKRSTFDESVPSTPMTYTGFSPTYNKEGASGTGPFFDGSSRFDSFNMHDGGLFSQRETLKRFDSMNSTNDFESGQGFGRVDSMKSTNDFEPGRGFGRFDSMRSNKDTDPSHGFPSFDDSDLFGSGPFKTSFGETPRRVSDIWSSETPRSTVNFGETPRSTYNFAETPKSTYNFGETSTSAFNWGETPRSTSDPWGETPRRASDNWGETPRRSSDNWGETPRKSSDPWAETPKRGSDKWSAF